MRAYILAAAVAVTSTVGADAPFVKGDELKAKIALECSDGCVTFNQEQAAEFEQQLQNLLASQAFALFVIVGRAPSYHADLISRWRVIPLNFMDEKTLRAGAELMGGAGRVGAMLFTRHAAHGASSSMSRPDVFRCEPCLHSDKPPLSCIGSDSSNHPHDDMRPSPR